MSSQDVHLAIHQHLKAMPWGQRPEEDFQAAMALQILEMEGNEVDIRACLYGGPARGGSFLCLTTRFLHVVLGNFSGPTDVGSFHLMQTGAIRAQPSSGRYSSTYVDLLILPHGPYVQRFPAKAARSFMESFDSLHAWTADNEPGAALSSLPLHELESAYGLTGISMDHPAALTCYRDRVELLQFTTEVDATALPYSLIDDISVTGGLSGLTSVTVHGKGFSLIGSTALSPAEVEGALAPATTELRALRMENHRSQQDPAPRAASNEANVLEIMRQLATLKDEGLLSQEEFDIKKVDLLARV